MSDPYAETNWKLFKFENFSNTNLGIFDSLFGDFCCYQNGNTFFLKKKQKFVNEIFTWGVN